MFYMEKKRKTQRDVWFDLRSFIKSDSFNLTITFIKSDSFNLPITFKSKYFFLDLFTFYTCKNSLVREIKNIACRSLYEHIGVFHVFFNCINGTNRIFSRFSTFTFESNFFCYELV